LDDRSICAPSYPLPQICLGGICQLDTRPKVCNRLNACCDPFGQVRDHGHVCKEYSIRKDGWQNPCKPPRDVCDPMSQEFDECPYTVLPPGTPCGPCTNTSNTVTCSNELVCGTGANYGQCVPVINLTSVQTPTTAPSNLSITCSSHPCPNNTLCTMVADQRKCVPISRPSCQYLCGQANMNYTEIGWPCDCRTDCSNRGTCCGDYTWYCGFSVLPNGTLIQHNTSRTSSLSVSPSPTLFPLSPDTSTNASASSLNRPPLYAVVLLALLAVGILVVVGVLGMKWAYQREERQRAEPISLTS
jgi:hypothetical protein